MKPAAQKNTENEYSFLLAEVTENARELDVEERVGGS